MLDSLESNVLHICIFRAVFLFDCKMRFTNCISSFK